MYVEDEVRGAAVWVLDFGQRGPGAVGDEVGGGGVVCSWQEDLLRSGACLPDRCYGCLDRCCPGCYVEVVLDNVSGWCWRGIGWCVRVRS